MTEAYKKTEPFEGKSFPLRMTVQHGQHELTPLHWHEHLELLKVLEGEVTIRVNNDELLAKQDDIIFINSSSVHSINTSPKTQASICCLVFDRFFISNVTEGFQTSLIYSLFLNSCNIDYHIRSSYPIWSELNDCLEKAYIEYTEKDLCYEMVMKSYIYKMITLILRYNRNRLSIGKDFSNLTSDFDRLKPVLLYIDANYANRIFNETLSDLINMSSCYFCKYFKKIIGLSPTKYINKVRIDKSIKYLVDTDLSITAICEKIGYCSINYYDKVFKQQKGISPYSFRKIVK